MVGVGDAGDFNDVGNPQGESPRRITILNNSTVDVPRLNAARKRAADSADGDAGVGEEVVGAVLDDERTKTQSCWILPETNEREILREDAAADQEVGGRLLAIDLVDHDEFTDPDSSSTNQDVTNNDGNLSQTSSFLNDTPDFSSFTINLSDFDSDKYIKIRLMVTNARSISPKINSLCTYFEELTLDVSIVTES